MTPLFPTPRPNRWRWLTAMLLAVAGLSSAGRAAEPVPVFVAKVERQPIYDTVEALGTLRANETVSLAATVTETIRDVHFEDGQMVEKGQILAELTSAEENAELHEAQSMLDEAQRQFERVKPLSESGAASGSLVDQRRREFQTAQARIDVIKSRLQDRLIIAPFAGVVGIRNISPGALVKPGDEITTLDDITPMKLDFSVAAVYLQDLRVGLNIVAESAAFPERQFEGAITSLGSRIDPVTRSINVRAQLPNPDGLLKPGLLMRVQLQCRPREALVVPEQAIVSRGQDQYVLRVDESVSPPVPRDVKVTLGTRMPGRVEITEGLSAGDVVITHGMRAQAGQPVVIKGVETPGKPLTQMIDEPAPQPQPAKEG